MSNLDNVVNEIQKDTETSVETNKTETSTNTPVELETSPEAPQNANNDVSEQSVEPEKKVDKSQFSDMEKAEYSFRKQLGKQRQKYENLLAEQKKAYEEMQSRLDKLENPDKYKEKLRDSFKTDDEYIDYLVGQRMQKYFEQENERHAQIQAENEEEERNQAAINTNINECFKTEAEQQDYYNVVKNAFEHGLEELMDKEQMCAQYILRSPNGPKILYELAKDPNKVKQIYSQSDPSSRFFELKMLERDILMRPQTQPAANPNLAKAVGTPGLAKGNTKDMFDDREDLRSFIRRR